MTLTLTSAVTSEDKVAVSYLNPTYTDLPRIKDEAGNPAKEFTDRAVHNNMPSTSNLVRALEQQKSSRNTPATGAPTIIGTLLPGQTLTADTSGIEDEDGLTRGPSATGGSPATGPRTRTFRVPPNPPIRLWPTTRSARWPPCESVRDYLA